MSPTCPRVYKGGQHGAGYMASFARLNCRKAANGRRLAPRTFFRQYIPEVVHLRLEGDGFELLVPRHKSRGFAQRSGHCGGIGMALKRCHPIVQPFSSAFRTTPSSPAGAWVVARWA